MLIHGEPPIQTSCVSGGMLFIQLPSGRQLSYVKPRMGENRLGSESVTYEGYYDPATYEALTNIRRDEMAAEKKAAYRPLIDICSPYA